MNILEARRMIIGDEVYKKTAEGNPVSVRSLARMRPGLKLFGRSEQFTTTGAQLLDVDNLSPDPDGNGIVSMVIADGGYEWESRIVYDTNRYRIAVKPNTNYTLSVGSITRGANLQISDYLQETKTGLDLVIVGNLTAFSFNPGELSEVTLSVFSSSTGASKITHIMLCEGTNVKPWEPYTGGKPSPSPDYPQEITSAGDDGDIVVDVTDGSGQNQFLTVQTPNGLPGIPVQSGGNYTDENGQQWICDEIDFKRGKYVQRVKRIENVRFTSTQDSNKLSQGLMSVSGILYGNGISNRYRYSYTAYLGTFSTGYGQLYVRFPIGTSISDMNDSIKGSVFFLPMSAPIETDLTEEQLSAYVNLHTNRPTTIVSATDDAGIKLTYKTKKSLEVT